MDPNEAGETIGSAPPLFIRPLLRAAMCLFLGSSSRVRPPWRTGVAIYEYPRLIAGFGCQRMIPKDACVWIATSTACGRLLAMTIAAGKGLNLQPPAQQNGSFLNPNRKLRHNQHRIEKSRFQGSSNEYPPVHPGRNHRNPYRMLSNNSLFLQPLCRMIDDTHVDIPLFQSY